MAEMPRTRAVSDYNLPLPQAPALRGDRYSALFLRTEPNSLVEVAEIRRARF